MTSLDSHRPLSKVVSTIFSLSLFSGIWGADLDTLAQQPSPPTTLKATRGLTQISSAEPMGPGRLTFCLTGSGYEQQRGFLNVPPKDALVTTGVTAFSFGVNSYIDIFGWVAGYGLFSSGSEFGMGSVSGGIQGSLPLPVISPLSFGAQLSVIGGTSQNQINKNDADGYDYFETRDGYDFMGKVLESLIFGSERRGVKLHLNQGAVMSLQTGHEMLLLLGAGIQGSVHQRLVLGLEINSRTSLKDIQIKNDPLWLTPSVQIRTPYFFTVLAGSDISLSKNRGDEAYRALEPYRFFGGFNFSFDLLESKRRALREKERSDAAEKAELEQRTQMAQDRGDSLTRKAYADSVAMAQAREAERATMAQKARQDSILLAEMQKKLEEERSKRSDAEKQLLSTGLLLLDAVYFETGKAEISINSYPYLNIIGKMLTKYPKLQIEISGHTDNIGKFQSNMLLSQARAEAVRVYLIQVASDLSSRFSARGYGSTQPKAPNNSASGRKVNRRVELQVLNKEALQDYK